MISYGQKKEVVCPMRRDLLIAEEWCDLVQQVDICKGCARNLGRGESKWQAQGSGG